MDSAEPLGEIAEAILRDVFPVECELAGSENLADLCQRRVALVEDGAAFRMSVGDSVSLLANAVTIVGFTWQIVVAVKKPKSAAATPEQIDQIVLAALPESAALPQERRLALYVAISAARRGHDMA